MSEENRTPPVGQWGRPMRKRSRGPQAQPSASSAPPVGPVDNPAALGGAETIIRASRPPAPSPELTSRREPDEEDRRLRDLVGFMARGLGDYPDDVSVEILASGSDASFELHVHPDDLGHVIGKQGRTARSLRLALGASASKTGRRAGLEIAD